ncbi:MAG: LD-carboxypeptidase [Flavobacteriales bacterium]|jgi:muramoyltetrapeptide carboxypeptidase|nr:LD-carboxypeptidase [Flavobacteriales bacterium]
MLKKIGLIATARFLENSQVLSTKKWLESKGFQVVVSSNVHHPYHQFAQNDQERAKAFNAMLEDSSIDILWCVRGGYGSVRVIDLIDWQLFQRNPKILVGFSDFTIFLNHILAFGAYSVHAPMPIQLPDLSETAKISLENAFLGKAISFEWTSSQKQNISIEGKLIGGNLSVLYSMMGSVSYPSTNNCILFLEDLDEYVYHIDRMMYGLYRNGSLGGLKAILLGSFTHIHDHKIPFGETVVEIMQKFCVQLSIPLFIDCPVGHINYSNSLCFGKVIEVSQNKNLISLKYSEKNN